jgi:secretion/DNA translocation related TadE-like protein
VVALIAGLHVGAAVLARHRAAAAADLAALAAAQSAVRGESSACHRAAAVAAGMGAQVVLCRLSGWDALVEVAAPVALALPGHGTAFGRARAGPVHPLPATRSRPTALPDRSGPVSSHPANPDCHPTPHEPGRPGDPACSASAAPHDER